LKFGVFLDVLHKRGDHKRADLYRHKVTLAFRGYKTFGELEQCETSDVLGLLRWSIELLEVAKSDTSVELPQRYTLGSYVSELESRGFSVRVNPAYQHLL